MNFIDLCIDVTVLRTSGESRGHEGSGGDEERRLVEGKWDSMGGDGYRQGPIQLKETVLTKPIAVFNECMPMKVSVGPEKWLKLEKCLLRRHESAEFTLQYAYKS